VSGRLDIPTLSTDRLILEPLTLTHSAGMFAMWRDPEVCRYSGPGFDLAGRPIRLPAETPDDSDKIIVFFLKGAADGERFRWAMLRREDRAFVGAIGFNRLGACAGLAYHLHPTFWGQGLAFEAAGLALAWLRARPDAVEVEAYVEPANTASVRLAERLGLRATGETEAGVADRYLMALAG
jgi:ribosomal-protein-alanine N-acetyltransferase